MKKTVFFIWFAVVGFSAAAQKPSPALNHIALYVQDVKKSAAFYRQIIQLDTIPEPFQDGRHTWLSIGPGISLHLIAGASDSMHHPKNHHLCLSTASFDAFVAHLRKNNIHFEDLKGNPNAITTRVDGIKQIYLQDPDGYWIEINSDAAPGKNR